MGFYSPSRVSGVSAIGCGTIPVVGFAVLGWWAVGFHFFWLLFAFFGMLALWAGLGTLKTSITVGEHGIRGVPWWWRNIHVNWQEVTSWQVEQDMNNARRIGFRIRNRWLRVFVHDSDVSCPGFDAFLEEVRAHLSEQEEAKPAGNAVRR
jgi:hypothetical protein